MLFIFKRFQLDPATLNKKLCIGNIVYLYVWQIYMRNSGGIFALLKTITLSFARF